MAKALQPTTGKIAKGIAQQITKGIGQEGMWSENPAQWWSNMFSNANTVNAFFNELVNVIISQRIKSESFDNPLEQFKTGQLPLGLGEAEIYFNPQTGRDFKTKVDDESVGVTSWRDNNESHNFNSRLFFDVLPDVKQVFFRVNYGKQYKRTYSDVELNNTMTTWEAVGQFIDAIARDLTASANIEEFDTMRNLFAVGYENNFIPVQPITGITDEATAKAFLVKAREYFTSFQFPSEQFSPWNAKQPEALIKTWSKKDRISIIMTAATAAVVDVYALAAAFNMDKADFMGKVVVVDKLDPDGKLAAVLFDDTFLHVQPKFEQSGSFFNPDTVKQNFYLTKTAIMSLDPFANAVAFSTDTFTDLTEAPENWATAYTDYYKKTGTTYTKLEPMTEAPAFEAGKYAQANA